jgi:lysophospholipase L1-like esterase
VGHLEGREHLGHLFEALVRIDRGEGDSDVRILQYGDSHTASDLGTSAFRRALQARFGDGGRGFVSIGKPWKTYAQDGVHGGMTEGFDSTRTKPHAGSLGGAEGWYGLLGVGIGASKGGERAWSDFAARATRLEIEYWEEPGGGSFDVFLDGALVGRRATRSDRPQVGAFAFDSSDSPHQVELRTVGDGGVRIFGMVLDRTQAGVVVDALGINGAQVFTPLHWSEVYFAEQLRRRSPDLVILAYGTNESLESKLTAADYEHALTDMRGRLSRASPASCLLLGPPDRAERSSVKEPWTSAPRLLEIVQVQRRVAKACSCAFFDQVEAMGGPGSIAAWATEPEPRARRDRVHLTRTGYAQLGESFAEDLMRAYDQWRTERGLPAAALRTQL